MSPAIEADVVESALEIAGVPARRRESGWVVPAGARRQREVLIVTEEDQVCIECVLADWDEIGSVQRDALTVFLSRAQACLKLAHLELRKRAAVAVAKVEAADIETSLGHATAAILAASQVLGTETAVLLNEEVAESYMRFHAVGREMFQETDRI